MKKIALVATYIMMVSCTMAQDIQLPAPDMNVKMTLMETLQKRASQREFSEASTVRKARRLRLLRPSMRRTS